jgi:hypothetical protein
MAQITDEQKANMQMVFNGLARYFKAMKLPDDVQKRVNEYMTKLWQIIKEYGTPESRKTDTEESEEYWVNFVRDMDAIYIQYNTDENRDIIRFIHWFMFDLVQITEKWNVHS